MKTLKYFLYVFVTGCLYLLPFNMLAQQTLQEQLAGKTRLWEIMEVVDRYYADDTVETFEDELLHWKRWEWFMSGRLGPGGEFVNSTELLQAAMLERDKMKPANHRNINSGWTFMGPSSSPLQNPDAIYNGIGRVDRIAFHPTDQNTIYIGTPAGGLWRTTDEGSTWSNLTDFLPSIGISGIVVSWDDPNDLYVLTGDGDSNISGFVEDFGYMRPSIGVLISTNGGSSWSATGIFPGTSGTYTGFRLKQSPDDPDLLIAATSDGLYRTTDGGDTWVQERTGVHYDVEFKPGDGTRVYASDPGDFVLSTDSGDTWTTVITYDVDPGNCGGRIEIAVAPTFTSKVYLLSGPVTAAGQFCGLWLSTDSGSSFTRQSNTPNVLGSADDGSDNSDQSSYDLAIACRTNASTTIVVAGLTAWRSTNGGSTWTHVTSYNENGAFAYIHPDIHDLVYNPLNHWLYCANDGGFYRSSDHGTTWVDKSPNIETSQFYHMRGWSGNVNKLMGGLQDNGVKYRMANSSAFDHIQGADGFDVAFYPDSGEPGYCSVNRSIVKFSGDGTGTSSVTPDGYTQFFKTLCVHNTDPDYILVGAVDILRSDDGGDSWTNEGSAGSWAITNCPSLNNRYYAAGGSSYQPGTGGLYFSNDSGDTWTDKSTNPGFPIGADWSKITDVSVRPNNSSQVWACFGGFDPDAKVVRSTNTGDTWSDVTYNLPNIPINCLAIDQDNGGYAGTDIGVFYLGPSMTEWMPWSNALPNTPVTGLYIFDDGTTRRLRAATFGRGVWQSNLAEACDAAVVVSGTLKGIRHYEATTTLTSTGDVAGGIGTFVSFQSGDHIILSPGFSITQNSKFLGFISPCGQGGIPSAQKDDSTETRSANPESIILLKRMYHPESDRPYGAIHHLSQTKTSAEANIELYYPGRVELIAAKYVQEKLAYLHSADLAAGKYDLSLDLSGLDRDFYYLLLMLDGNLIHFQELDLRE